MRHIHLDITDSTNQDAKKRAGEADFGPLWITAGQQTLGRGRTGRDWISPKGNFYGSHLFPTDLRPDQRGLYSFAAALAVFDTVSELCPNADLTLKWPNDVLLGGAKLSGLLLETGQTHTQAWVIMGIGINVASYPEGLDYAATSLSSLSGETVTLEKLRIKLVDKIDHWKRTLEISGFRPLRVVWLDRAANVPGKVNVRLPTESFSGEAVDLGQDGSLHVRLANGTIRQVHAGDVFPG